VAIRQAPGGNAASMPTTHDEQDMRELAPGRLDDASLARELALAQATLVRPDHLLNSLAVCKMIYVDGRPSDWLHLYTNPAWEAQSGQPSAAGMYASEMFPGINELDPEVLETFARVAAGGPPERFTRYLRSAGQWFDVQVSCQRPGYFIAVFDVVTERVERERALNEAQHRLALAQTVSKSGIWDWDIPSGELFWTPEMFRLLGFDPATTVASFDTWRRVVHPDDIEVAEDRVNTAVRTRTPMYNDYRVVADDGRIRWIRGYGDTLYDEAGRPLRMLGLCLDVTDLKQLSDQAAEAYAASVAKSNFLATMSHELRTPLNSIIGFTSLILEGLTGPVNAEQSRQLAIVKRSGEQLLELISELLDIAQVESGNMAIELSAVPLRPLLLEQHETLRPLAEVRGLTLEAPVCDEGLRVRADPRRLSQVVRNLLSNSVKFTDHGHVTVKVRASGTLAHVEIRDTGIGIANEELGRIFTPFRRASDPRSASRAGTGLGLSISRSLVLAMGGKLSVESQVGQGSTFTVSLPIL
jgi:PAS domain S-box-containing protein